MTQWQYTIIFNRADAKQLDALGADGWELCAAIPLNGRILHERHLDLSGFVLYFKRPMPPVGPYRSEP